jgi:hypothetical protein
MAEQANQGQQNIQVKIDPTMEGGIYSNAVSVHVNQNEVILDFGYILPNMKPTTIKVVNRINISHQTAESFMKVLSNAMLDWRNRQKEVKENKGK